MGIDVHLTGAPRLTGSASRKMNDRQVLEQLAQRIRAMWENCNGCRKSLDFIREVGRYLKKAHDICVPQENGEMPPMTWYKWLEEAAINRKAAYECHLIYTHWDLVKDLSGRQRNQTMALQRIRELRRKPRSVASR